MRARGDADSFLLLGETDEDHLRVIFRHPDEAHEPCLRKGRDQPNSICFQRFVNQLRILYGNRHARLDVFMVQPSEGTTALRPLQTDFKEYI